jgi:hypothetical protein
VVKRTCQLGLVAFLGSCLLLPAAALAASQKKKPSGGCASAVCVYREQQHTPTGNQVLGQGSSAATPLSQSASTALAGYNGSDKSEIQALATNPGYSIGRKAPSPSGRVAAGPTPRATGSFDLGTGGTTLFVLLAASAGLVVLGAAVRLWLRR